MPAVAPREPARAAESALSLLGDLDRQLGRSREMEESLRADLHQARTELARAAGDAEGARARLGALEKELEERRGMMGEMLAEMTALEEERDQSVRRAHIMRGVQRISTGEFVSAIAGLIIGLLIGLLLGLPMANLPDPYGWLLPIGTVVVTGLGMMGLTVAKRHDLADAGRQYGLLRTPAASQPNQFPGHSSMSIRAP